MNPFVETLERAENMIKVRNDFLIAVLITLGIPVNIPVNIDDDDWEQLTKRVCAAIETLKIEKGTYR
jgi:hypothetical protein